MANEATVRASLAIRTGNLNYQSQPASFQADVAGVKGPTPGALSVSPRGTIVDLSQLTTPGLCRVQNLSESDYFELGVYDVETDVFYPLLEFLPGESFVMRLSRNLGEEYVGTGTGTTAATNRLMGKANTEECVGVIDVFEA